jgi:hypothetical protein
MFTDTGCYGEVINFVPHKLFREMGSLGIPNIIFTTLALQLRAEPGLCERFVSAHIVSGLKNTFEKYFSIILANRCLAQYVFKSDNAERNRKGT